MALLAIALGIVLPVMAVYYIIKDLKQDWEKEKRDRAAIKAYRESKRALKKSKEKQ